MFRRHVTRETAARLIDGVGRRPGDAKALRHVRSCPHCSALLRECAIYRSLWEAGDGRFETDEELISLGEAAASRASHPGDRALPSMLAPGGRFRRPVMVAGLAAALAVAAVSIWIGFAARQQDSAHDGLALALVRDAVREATIRGPFIFPSTEDASVPAETPVYRSAFIPASDSLDAALSRMFDSYEAGNCPPEETYWLVAGCAAVGRMDLARNIIDDARRRGEADRRLDVIEALILCSAGEDGRAESMLRSAVDASPDDPVARVNLAVILARQGRRSEAEALLASISPAPPGSIIRSRINSLGSAPRE